MKRLLLTLLCLAGVGSHSQDYIPFLNDSKWYLHYSGFLAADDIFWSEPVGELNVNDTVYTHYQETLYPYLGNPDYPAVNDYYIREDIGERRVYKRQGNTEYLLYDFSLEVGDDVAVHIYGEPYSFTVTAKDSFAVNTGRKRVMLTLYESNGYYDELPEYWIEGMGSTFHPLNTFQMFTPDGWFTTLCSYNGNEIPYSLNEFNNEPFTCPEPPGEPEDDYIPLINNNSFYIHLQDMLFEDTHWTQPIGTTTVNDTVYTHYKENFIGPNETAFENDYYIREEVDAKKVYKRIGNQDFLLYDFSLVPGDNVTLYPDGDAMEFTVVAKDSFAVNLGRQRVRLILEMAGGNDEGQEVWIEGLGNLHHPLKGFHDYIQDPAYTLLCNNYNGDVPYTVSEFESQPFTCPEVGEKHEGGLSAGSHSLQSISVYPNPFSSSFILKSGEYLDNATLTLHDITGRLIREQDITGNEIEISRGCLPNGIYMLRIWKGGRPILSQKLVAE